MKKTILLLIIFSAAVMAQEIPALIGDGLLFSDSLKNYSSTYESDSAKIVSFNYKWGFFSVMIWDTSITNPASIKLYKGVVRYTGKPRHLPVDTLWGSEALPCKNNGWTVDTVLTGGGKIKFYTILEDNIELLKVINVDTTAIPGQKVDVVIEARKRY